MILSKLIDFWHYASRSYRRRGGMFWFVVWGGVTLAIGVGVLVLPIVNLRHC